MKILTKYNKTTDITNIDNVTQKEYLESLAKTSEQKLQAPDDYYQPYTYEEWYNRNVGFISGQEHKQYELYLKNWNKTRYTSTDVTNDLKNDYIAFLQNLTLIIDKEDKTKWLNDINWDDPLEVEQVIPFYAKKLKEIALYLINKRESLKKSKLKYNMTGATQALERIFYEYFLKAFTKRDYVLNIPDETLYSLFPDLSAVKNGFKIQIDELYDDTSYFDKNPSKSTNFYFDLSTFNSTVTGYYNSQNIAPSSYDWVFRTGFTSLCSDNPLFFIMENIVNSNLPASSYIDLEDKILNEYYQVALAQKYIGESQYYASSGYYTLWQKPIEFSLVQGNNWFYWPSGEYLEEANLTTIDPILLTNTNLIQNGAKGYSNYLSADKIFIRVGNNVSGAWLKSDSINTLQNFMSAGLYTDNINIFKFPFPGYGLSGEDISWSGAQLSNLSKDYEYLEQDVKDEINKAYWTNTTFGSSVCAISIHDTNLIENGATAGYTYDQADRISVRISTNSDNVHDSTPNEIYQNTIKHAWLYKMYNTDIPLARGQNYINWPVERYSKNSTTLYNVLTSQCKSYYLANISPYYLIGARAGSNLYDSDIVYKLDKRNGTPIECAFLSGAPLNMIGATTFTANATGVKQPALSLNCEPNKEVTFIWTDEDTPISQINISHKDHQPDCPYLFEKHHSLYKENPSDQKNTINYKQWQSCECKAIQYSPLGHSGTKYDDYNGYADIIYLDLLYPLPFNKTIWVGSDGNDYKTSMDFAWFKLSNDNTFQKDVGWGKGSWVTGDGSEFILRKGYQYKYRRSDLGHDTSYLVDGTVPNLIIKVPYQDQTGFLWVKAVADSNGNWQSYDEMSDMVINAADYLVYDHIDSNWYCITGIGDYGTSITYSDSSLNLTNNPWQNYDFTTSGVLISIAWPTEFYSNGPNVLASDLETVYWKVQTPNLSVFNFKMTPEEILNIFADQIGTWNISVTGQTSLSSTYIYSNIANFVVSPRLATTSPSGSLSTNTIYSDTINFTINVPLYGWDYATNSFNVYSRGARPFWALASDEDNKITKHKGIDVWGGGIRVVDDYVLLTQPEFSDIYFETDNYVEYKAQNNLIWIEPLTFNVNITSSNWCDLIIDTSKQATLSSYLYNIDSEMIVSATENTSKLILTPLIDELPVFVNYYANNAFTWSEILSDTSLGIPPTGGIFVPIVSGLHLESDIPYANLINRHFPTIATVSHVENLYSSEDSGGYFIPKMLGISTALSKNTKNTINSMKIPNNGTNLNSYEVFTNLEQYNSDNSTSKTDQNIIVENESTDSTWMKAPITNWKKSGFIIDAANHQQFIPYKTNFEINRKNYYGLHQQNDAFDPWFGEADDIWENTIDWPTNFTKQYNIEKWYTQFPNQNYEIYQWKTDIFNNQYALLKNLQNISTSYDKKHLINGTLWVRDTRNIVQPASSILTDIYTGLSSITTIDEDVNVLLNENILDIDVFYDTLMYYTSAGIFFFKLDLDYDTGTITSEINENIIIPLSTNNLYGGTWLSKDKTVTICTLLSSDYQIRPVLIEYNIDDNRLTELYNISSSFTNMSAYNLTAIEHPVLTYNDTYSIYNISYIGYNDQKEGMYLTTINIQKNENDFEIIDTKIVIPNA